MTDRVLVTAGPTLSAVDVHALLPQAEVVAPIAHGDIYGYGLGPGDTLAVIDGLFLQVASVRHRELLECLEGGVRVFGASSMGALRAAELHPYGMVGVGEVFEGFLRGRWDGDDEVAVVHGLAEDGYPIFADALVNLRSTLDALVSNGFATPGEQEMLVQEAKHRSFERRHVAEVLHDIRASGRLGTARAAELGRLLRRERVDLKRRDALLLLKTLASASVQDQPPRPVRQRSYFTHRWRLAHAAPPDGLDAARLLVTAAVVADDFADWRHGQLLEVVAAMHARATNAAPAPGDPLVPLATRSGTVPAALITAAAAAGVSERQLAEHADTLHLADAALAASPTGRVPPARVGRRAALEQVAVAHAELVGLTGPDRRLPDRLVTQLLGGAGDDPVADIANVVTRTLSRSPGVPLDDALIAPLRLSGAIDVLGDLVHAAAVAVGRFHAELPGATLQSLRADALDGWLAQRWGAAPSEPELLARGLADADLRAAAGPLVLLSRLATVPRLRLTVQTTR